MNPIIETQTPLGRLAVRDAVPEDAAAYCTYWQDSSDLFLQKLGVDRHRLGSSEDMYHRFQSMIRTEGAANEKVIFSITMNNELIGYTNFNRVGDSLCRFGHIHTYTKYIKRQIKEKHEIRLNKQQYPLTSIGKIVIGLALLSAFKSTEVKKIIAQTRTSNIHVNRSLSYYTPADEEKYFEQPDGLSNPGDFQMRYFYRERTHELEQKLFALSV